MNIEISKVKISVTIPENHLEDVRNAICTAGAGNIGNYSFCSNSCKCIGTFIPNNDASPFIGSKNTLEYVNEEKLEVICDIKNVKQVISVLRKVHPYEEPDINIIPLLDENLFN